MSARPGLKAAFFRIPTDLDDGVKLIASRRCEAAAVVVREILREGLVARGIIDGGLAGSSAAPTVKTARDFR
jgi:hypothetical protein